MECASVMVMFTQLANWWRARVEGKQVLTVTGDQSVRCNECTTAVVLRQVGMMAWVTDTGRPEYHLPTYTTFVKSASTVCLDALMLHFKLGLYIS